MTKNRTPTPVYLDPGMHPGLEVKGLRLFEIFLSAYCNGINIFTTNTGHYYMFFTSDKINKGDRPVLHQHTQVAILSPINCRGTGSYKKNDVLIIANGLLYAMGRHLTGCGEGLKHTLMQSTE